VPQDCFSAAKPSQRLEKEVGKKDERVTGVIICLLAREFGFVRFIHSKK
jgi:hypothetical protein